MHAILGETLGKGLPDAVGGAGDDGNFVFVTFGHCFSLRKFLIVIPGEPQSGEPRNP
jgi:hypothetical protein